MTHSPKKILLLNFPTETSGNWGCLASSNGFGWLVREKFPGAEIQNVPIHFNLPSRPPPQKAEGLPEYCAYLRRLGWPDFLRLMWADIVILNGEGSIHEFEEPRFNDLALIKLALMWAAKNVFGKTTMIVNHSIFFWSGRFADFVRTVYAGCDYVSAREPRSIALLRALGVVASLAPDTAFLADTEGVPCVFPSERIARVPDGEYFVVFLSQLVGRHGDYLAELLSALVRRLGLRPVFFVLSPGELREVGLLEEAGIRADVYDRLYDPRDIIAVLRGAAFCLSGRFHACIFSCLANTPFLGFRSNTFKVGGLLEFLGWPFPEHVFGETGPEVMVGDVEKILARRAELSLLLREKSRQAVGMIVSACLRTNPDYKKELL